MEKGKGRLRSGKGNFMEKRILAIDIGGSKMLAGVMRLTEDAADAENVENGAKNRSSRKKYSAPEILKTVGESLPVETTKDGILETIWRLATALLAEYPLETIDSVGVTIPGLADERVWIYAPFSGIQNFPVVDILEKRFGKPVFIENDVNACAIAEGIFGACREADDFIWLTISNGIGGGVVLNGRIYRGARGFSGEFGHVNVVEDGELCGCGNRGCLEAECAGPGISRFYARLTGEQTSAAEIATRALAGEENALKAFVREGKILGHALANAANILNPEKIIIGGGVSRAWDLFAPALKSEFQKNIFRRANANVVIEPTALGYEAALIGAAALTLPEAR